VVCASVFVCNTAPPGSFTHVRDAMPVLLLRTAQPPVEGEVLLLSSCCTLAAARVLLVLSLVRLDCTHPGTLSTRDHTRGAKL
jgi:hypothetical protein